jgi:hypothetical protein
MNRASWGRLAKLNYRISGTDYQDQRLAEHLAFGDRRSAALKDMVRHRGNGNFTPARAEKNNVPRKRSVRIAKLSPQLSGVIGSSKALSTLKDVRARFADGSNRAIKAALPGGQQTSDPGDEKFSSPGFFSMSQNSIFGDDRGIRPSRIETPCEISEIRVQNVQRNTGDEMLLPWLQCDI